MTPDKKGSIAPSLSGEPMKNQTMTQELWDRSPGKNEITIRSEWLLTFRDMVWGVQTWSEIMWRSCWDMDPMPFPQEVCLWWDGRQGVPLCLQQPSHSCPGNTAFPHLDHTSSLSRLRCNLWITNLAARPAMCPMSLQNGHNWPAPDSMDI